MGVNYFLYKRNSLNSLGNKTIHKAGGIFECLYIVDGFISWVLRRVEYRIKRCS